MLQCAGKKQLACCNGNGHHHRARDACLPSAYLTHETYLVSPLREGMRKALKHSQHFHQRRRTNYCLKNAHVQFFRPQVDSTAEIL